MITAPVETETAAPPGAPATSDAWRVDESVMLTSAQALRRNLNLVRELAVTQFKLKYTGSVLGYLWSLIKPLMVFGMLYTVFELVLHAGRGTANFPMQLLVGIVLYTFFAETTGVAVNTVVTNGGIIKRAFFPRVILIIAATLIMGSRGGRQDDERRKADAGADCLPKYGHGRRCLRKYGREKSHF